MFGKKKQTAPPVTKPSTPSVSTSPGAGNDAVKSAMTPSSGESESPLLDTLGASEGGGETTGEGKDSSGKTGEAKAEPKSKAPGVLDRLFKTARYREWQESRIDEEIEALKPNALLTEYWDELYQFAETEFSTENLDLYEAIEGGATPSSIFKLWIGPNSTYDANLPSKVVADLTALAEQDRYDEMDFTDALRATKSNLTDTAGRFRSSKLLRDAVRKRIS